MQQCSAAVQCGSAVPVLSCPVWSCPARSSDPCMEQRFPQPYREGWLELLLSLWRNSSKIQRNVNFFPPDKASFPLFFLGSTYLSFLVCLFLRILQKDGVGGGESGVRLQKGVTQNMGSRRQRLISYQGRAPMYPGRVVPPLRGRFHPTD